MARYDWEDVEMQNVPLEDLRDVVDALDHPSPDKPDWEKEKVCSDQ